jgi:predicted DNA-binding transcriptional regulator AlpA
MEGNMAKKQEWMSMQDIADKYGIRRALVLRRIVEGEFPRGVRFGPKLTLGWTREFVEANAALFKERPRGQAAPRYGHRRAA